MSARRNRLTMPTIGQQRRTDPMLVLVITALTILVVGTLATLIWLGNQPRLAPAAVSQGVSSPVARLVWLETHDPDMPVVELLMDAMG